MAFCSFTDEAPPSAHLLTAEINSVLRHAILSDSIRKENLSILHHCVFMESDITNGEPYTPNKMPL